MKIAAVLAALGITMLIYNAASLARRRLRQWVRPRCLLWHLVGVRRRLACVWSAQRIGAVSPGRPLLWQGGFDPFAQLRQPKEVERLRLGAGFNLPWV